jgi:hypothetical protein
MRSVVTGEKVSFFHTFIEVTYKFSEKETGRNGVAAHAPRSRLIVSRTPARKTGVEAISVYRKISYEAFETMRAGGSNTVRCLTMPP